MIADLLGAWSAALAVWLCGGAVFCALRLVDIWDDLDCRRRILSAGIVIACLGWCWHQAYATYAWISVGWAWSFAGWHGAGSRAAMTIGILAIGGAMSFDRCRHRGWLGLTAIGLLTGGIALIAAA
ncbi:hypothetical protein [Vineibacter terrae]|uniref:hypothetical protein n=1 Tax=Vineibacter terrae TaxID=2586908 RepID=UPI002E3162F4|nr:hypothetical protein [Vineibacter terrae]HEX2888905.1 hypothetical protein [Vineibacter terrae]